jgi:hypothetical protein
MLLKPFLFYNRLLADRRNFETERLTALEQVPTRQVESVAAQISTWLRTAFEQFLGSESSSLMAITHLASSSFRQSKASAESCTERLPLCILLAFHWSRVTPGQDGVKDQPAYPVLGRSQGDRGLERSQLLKIRQQR